MELSPNVEPNKLYDVTMAHQDLSTNNSGTEIGAFQVKSDDVDFSPPSNGKVGIKRTKHFSDSSSEGSSPKKRVK